MSMSWEMKPARSAVELEVLALVALGWTNTQVPGELQIAAEIVKTRR
jgi:ATP/maltotriose-dependent transcriptional regulator MalT